MSQDSGRVIVVGGGVIGIASAYYLAKAGRDVTLIDRGEIAMGCSDGNCGLLCPSHVLPLAEPGAVSTALKALLKRKPVYGFLFDGKRYDAGDKVGYLKATIELALKSPSVNKGFREYLLSTILT